MTELIIFSLLWFILLCSGGLLPPAWSAPPPSADCSRLLQKDAMAQELAQTAYTLLRLLAPRWLATPSFYEWIEKMDFDSIPYAELGTSGRTLKEALEALPWPIQADVLTNIRDDLRRKLIHSISVEKKQTNATRGLLRENPAFEPVPLPPLLSKNPNSHYLGARRSPQGGWTLFGQLQPGPSYFSFSDTFWSVNIDPDFQSRWEETLTQFRIKKEILAPVGALSPVSSDWVVGGGGYQQFLVHNQNQVQTIRGLKLSSLTPPAVKDLKYSASAKTIFGVVQAQASSTSKPFVREHHIVTFDPKVRSASDLLTIAPIQEVNLFPSPNLLAEEVFYSHHDEQWINLSLINAQGSTQEIIHFLAEKPRGGTLSSDGHYFAVETQDAILIFNLQHSDGAPTHTIPIKFERFSGLSFSPNNQYLSGIKNDGVVSFWHWPTKTHLGFIVLPQSPDYRSSQIIWGQIGADGRVPILYIFYSKNGLQVWKVLFQENGF